MAHPPRLAAALAALTALGLFSCSSSPDTPAAPAVTVDAGASDVVVEAAPPSCDPYAATATGNDALVGPTGLEAALTAAIGASTKTLEVMAAALDRKAIVAALVDAKKRGVAVRVVGDKATTKLVRSALGDAAVHDGAFPAYGAKALVIDGAKAFVGSLDLTDLGLDKQRGYVAVVSDAARVGALRTFFDADFEGKAAALPGCAFAASPGDGEDRLVAHIEAAEERLDLELRELSAPRVVAAIRARAAAKVPVRVLFAGSDVVPSTAAAGTDLKAAGCEVRYFRDFEVNAGFVQNEKGALVGSHVPIAATFAGGRFLSAFVSDDATTEKLATQFDADWTNAALR